MMTRLLLLCLCVCACTPVRPLADPALALRDVEALVAKHDLSAALRLADRSLESNTRRDEPYARMCILKSNILVQRSGLDDALAFLNSVPKINVPSAAYILKRQQASLENSLGKLEQAALHLEEAIPLAEASGNLLQVAGTEVARAPILLKLHRLEEAQRCLNTAKQYGEATGERSLDPYIFKYTGTILLDSNRFESALAPLQTAYKLFTDSSKPQLAAKVLIDVAWAYYRLGRLDKAQELYEKAEADIPAIDKHLCVGHIGNIFYDRGDMAQAAANYKKAAELARNVDKNYYSTWLSNFAMTLADQSQWTAAAQYNTEALAIARTLSGSIALNYAMVTAGRIAAGRHDFAAAEKQLTAVEQMANANPAAVLDAYSALARIYAENNRPQDARRQFESAMQLVDRTRTGLREDEDKISYLASLIKLHRQYVAFLMAQGDAPGAFQVAELSRARVLRDRLNVQRRSVTSRSLADYRKLARETATTYLVYWVAPERSFVWVIDGAAFTAHPLPGETRLRTLVERHQQSVERTSDGPTGSAELFATVVPASLKAKRYVIVPDGPLYGLNFETLRHAQRYWIEEAAIAVAPSLELLLSAAAPRTSTPNVLLVGDAVQWTPEFPRLLNAAKEIARIGHHFPPGSQTVLAGTSATRAAFAGSNPVNYSFVHFAAHAVANRNAPLDSAIILSQGRLSVKDVLATPVHAQLVTISACSSAGARTYSGEGLVGLAWAFLQSGAHSVVAGLWDVSDYSSPILMDSLYEGLTSGKEPMEALRAAKLKLLQPGGKYADPYYWGALQLYLGAR